MLLQQHRRGATYVVALPPSAPAHVRPPPAPSSHYKNTPNDLQMLSDAPAHQVFVLLGPLKSDGSLPDILCAVQVCFEGEISKQSLNDQLKRGQRPAGDLIPWTISE